LGVDVGIGVLVGSGVAEGRTVGVGEGLGVWVNKTGGSVGVAGEQAFRTKASEIRKKRMEAVLDMVLSYAIHARVAP
jgi:hypothetical protein